MLRSFLSEAAKLPLAAAADVGEPPGDCQCCAIILSGSEITCIILIKEGRVHLNNSFLFTA